MLSEIFGGKAWFKSLTAWGLLAIAVAKAYGEQELPGSVMVAQYLPTVGVILAGLGIRRAATAPDVAVSTEVKPA